MPGTARTNGRAKATKAPARKTTPHPTSNAKLAVQVADLQRRVKVMEDMFEAAKKRQEQMLAQQLAKNPDQLAQLRSVLAQAENPQPLV